MKIQRIKISLGILMVSFFGLLNYSNVLALDTPFFDESKVTGTFMGRGMNSAGNSLDVDLNGARSANGMKGNITNEIGVKWKIFDGGAQPSSSMVWSGYDFNGDGGHDILYGYGGKLYLQDIASGISIWETKALAIGKIISVESLLGDTLEKQIVVQFSEKPYLMGVLDGKTGEIIKTSQVFYNDMSINGLEYSTSTPIIKHKDNGEIYIIFSGSSTYNFGMKLYEDAGNIFFEPLYNDKSLSSTWGGGKREIRPAIGNIAGKEVIIQNGRSTYNVLDLTSSSIGNGYVPLKEITKSRFETHYGATDKHFAYDFNNDGNDEYITWAHNYYRGSSQYQDGYVMVGGKSNIDNSLTQYWALETDYNATNNGAGVTTVRVAKNYSNLDNSHLFVQNANNPAGTVREAYKFSGSGSENYNTSNNYSSFNLKLDHVYDGSNGSIAGIFDNGNYDLVILYKDSKYNFYKYSGSGSFIPDSTAQISGSFYDIATPFDDKLFSQRVIGNYAGVDTDSNGLKEFIVSEGDFFKFYEIYEDVGYLKTRLVKELDFSGETGSVLKRGLTSDLQNMWSISYESAINQLHVFYSDYGDSDADGYESFKKINVETYAGGTINTLKIVKINDKNYILYKNDLYNAENASPNTPPVVVKSGFGNGYVIDVDPALNDGNEYIINSKTYTINTDFTLTEKYISYGMDGDFNGDGILDRIELGSDGSGNRRQTSQIRTVSGKDGSILTPRKFLGGCSQYSQVDYKIGDYNGDGIDDIFLGGTWCTSTYEGIFDGSNLNFINNITSNNNLYLYDTDNDGSKEWTSRTSNYYGYSFQNIDLEGGSSSIKWTKSIPSDIFYGSDISSISLNKDNYGVNMVLKIFNGRLVSFDTSNGDVKFDNYYYGEKSYSNMIGGLSVPSQGYNAVFLDGGVPVMMADALLADIDDDGKNEILAGSYDGNLYIINAESGEIEMTYNVGTSIKRFFHGDTNNDGILDILLSSEDGYIYQFANSNLNAPVGVKDGPLYGYDIQTQLMNNTVYVNFEPEIKATGYFVQLYNKTEKSVVFDWKDIGNNVKGCIISPDFSDSLPSGCLQNDKNFSLNGKSIYVWRIMSYNDSVTSDIIESNGFSVLNVTIDKKVKLKEDFNGDYVDSVTVAPGSIVQYKITINNDSLISLGGLGYLNYDIIPPVSATSCDGITDCRVKNLIINDYMPTTFSYMSNSTIIKVEDIYLGNIGKKVSDSYFVKDGTSSETTLSTSPGATLRWKFPLSVVLLPGKISELIFDAIAK